MNRLTRYIFRQCFGVSLFVTAGLTAAAWLIQSLKLIELVVDRGAGIGLFAEMAILSLPQLLAIVLPIGCFIGVLFTYNKLINDSELVVMRACGLSQWGLAWPAILLATLGTLIMLSLSAYFLPASKNAFRDMQFQIRNQFAAMLLQDGTFNNLSDTLMVYVRSRDANGQLLGMLIQDTRDPQRPVTMTAESGAVIQAEGTPRLVMMNGTKQTWDAAKHELSVLSFDQLPLDLDDYRDTPGARVPQADERYLPELFWPSDVINDPQFTTRLVIEAHNRLVNPLYCLSYVLIGLACLLSGELSRRGHGWRLVIAYGLVTLVQTSALGAANIVSRNLPAVPLLYLNALLPIAVGAFLTFGGYQFFRRSVAGPREAAA